MGSPEADRRAQDIGRKAARLLRRSRPALDKAVADARPRVEKAAQDAWRYAQEHEDEIKRTALRAARLNVRGPFGFVVDAMSNSVAGSVSGETSAQRTCGACSAPSEPSARFCTQCGAR
ncbi:MAG TPA: hypothetical protein VG845_04595, partial [Dehalococcoidia bacterium]|nr:hypothetical protein [Dehalococcoidia bacterium]